LKFHVELLVHAVDAPGTRLRTNENLALNICILGQRHRTKYFPANFPLHVGQTLYFEKVFRNVSHPRDVLQRLEREHVLIELVQSHVPSSILLANYETSAKDFLYPYSAERIQYVGLRRYLLLSRTIDFPGVSPSFEFTVSPSFIELGGAKKVRKVRKSTRPKSPPVVNVRPTSPTRVSRSVTSHTIASAVKSNYDQPETREKLRELAIEGQVKFIVPIDKTLGRDPFVVRHVDESLIGRQPQSHDVFNDGLIVNDYSLSRSASFDSPRSRSRSPSPSRRRARSRSPSPSRSVDFERRFRSPSPKPFDTYSSCRHGEIHSMATCDICRLHRLHVDESQRGKSLEQRRYSTRSFSPDIYAGETQRFQLSPTLQREAFRQRYCRSPVEDLTEKIIRTSRRHIDDYNLAPRPRCCCYSPSRYSSVHYDDDDLLERSCRLTRC